MSLETLPLSLKALDRTHADLVVLTLFEDERPLRGLNGLVDWRWDGKLSRSIASGEFSGKMGERLLLTTDRYLSMQRMAVFGLGLSKQFDQATLTHVWDTIWKSVQQLCPKSLALALPGRIQAPQLLKKHRSKLTQLLENEKDFSIFLFDGADTSNAPRNAAK